LLVVWTESGWLDGIIFLIFKGGSYTNTIEAYLLRNHKFVLNQFGDERVYR
jgi:hypothetical protein